MKIAIPHWQGRVSPVFDVARNILLVEIADGAETNRKDVAFDMDSPRLRMETLTRVGADVLICGAISRPLETAISLAGIEVIPQTCGEVEHVLEAFIDGRLGQDDTFLMPGCCGRHRGRRQGRRRGWNRTT